ncbi:hypothetical protein RJT34_25042 [Clitoria ternatea]|uniref:Uncharacterized protein n=1 Tax=Clitoria ternatea TaxID=43366 RepID=A0AAN9FPC4_CLITE
MIERHISVKISKITLFYTNVLTSHVLDSYVPYLSHPILQALHEPTTFTLRRQIVNLFNPPWSLLSLIPQAKSKVADYVEYAAGVPEANVLSCWKDEVALEKSSFSVEPEGSFPD